MASSKRTVVEVDPEEKSAPPAKKLTARRDWCYNRQDTRQIMKKFHSLAVLEVFQAQIASMFNRMKSKYQKQPFSNYMELSYAFCDMASVLEDQFADDKLAEPIIGEIKKEVQKWASYLTKDTERDEHSSLHASLWGLVGETLDSIQEDLVSESINRLKANLV